MKRYMDRRSWLLLPLLLGALLLPVLPALPSQAFAAEQVTTLKVEGMTCFLCPFTIKGAIKKEPGVLAVTIKRRAGWAKVRYDDQLTTPQRIAQASTKAGYRATPEEVFK